MSGALLQPLLGAVRRVLWRNALARAMRGAAWVAAALVVAASAWHLALGALPWAVLAALVGLPALAALAWAAQQRPDDAACAHFADRQLGGASAYGTWLDQRPAALTPACQHLQAWVAARLPSSLQALAQQRAPLRLARPLATLAVCLVLAVFVFSRPAPPAPGSDTAAVTTAAAPAAPASAVPDLATDLARALRAAAAPAPEAPRRAGTAAAAGDGRSAEARAEGARDAAPTPGATSPGRAAQGTATASPGPAPAAAQPSGLASPAAPGSGRDAGDSRDAQGPGASRAAPAAAASHRRELPPSRNGETMMDGLRAGRFAETTDAPPTQMPLPAAAPAMPPTATATAVLSPAQARYVQAWRQAQR